MAKTRLIVLLCTLVAAPAFAGGPVVVEQPMRLARAKRMGRAGKISFATGMATMFAGYALALGGLLSRGSYFIDCGTPCPDTSPSWSTPLVWTGIAVSAAGFATWVIGVPLWSLGARRARQIALQPTPTGIIGRF
jgi:hypothetical protein